jgi:hypothetical protein
MMNAQVLVVLLLSWLTGATIAAILICCKAKPGLVYCVYIGLGLLTGLAYDWAYGMSGSTLGWVMIGVCSLLWLQGAWLVASVIPRWIAISRNPQDAGKKSEAEV